MSNIDETKNRIASRFQVGYGGELVGSHATFWLAREAAVAYMHKFHVSPVTIWDSMSSQPAEFQTGSVHVQAYEGSPEVVAARALIASRD